MRSVSTSVFSILILAAAMLGSSGAASAQRTDAQISESLLWEVFADIPAAAAKVPDARGVALLRPRAANLELEAIQDRVGNFLGENGFEVWMVASVDSIPDGVLLLDFVVDVAGFDYPSRRDGLLGFGDHRLLRRAALGVQGRLEDPRDGHWLWRSAPRSIWEDWISGDEVETLAADRPLWMDGDPLSTPEQRSAWLERSVVAGLLGSVIILYFDGTK